MRTAILAIVCLLVAVGCDRGPQLGTVTGTVTWEGKPLAGATVTFTPPDGRSAVARTSDDGKYELRFADGRPGAVVGENGVVVETFRVDLDAEGNPVEHPEILPAKFHVDSQMVFTVQPGAQVIDLHLTKKK